jgi:hypothetical protein
VPPPPPPPEEEPVGPVGPTDMLDEIYIDLDIIVYTLKK